MNRLFVGTNAQRRALAKEHGRLRREAEVERMQEAAERHELIEPEREREVTGCAKRRRRKHGSDPGLKQRRGYLSETTQQLIRLGMRRAPQA